MMCVVAHAGSRRNDNSGIQDEQGVLPRLWTHLLPPDYRCAKFSSLIQSAIFNRILHFDLADNAVYFAIVSLLTTGLLGYGYENDAKKAFKKYGMVKFRAHSKGVLSSLR